LHSVLDSIDALAPRFGGEQSGSDVYRRILSQLLREIDNLRDVKGVILLAATDHPERIEPALLRSGRFDYILPFANPALPTGRRLFGCVAGRCRFRPISISRIWPGG